MTQARQTSIPLATRRVRVLIFSASLRADSLNSRLAHLARSVLGAAGAIVDWGTMTKRRTSYNRDVEAGTDKLQARESCTAGSQSAMPS